MAATQTKITQTSTNILWAQVWGLATVQGAISLTWVIYNLYLKQLLTEFGFPPTLAAVLLIVENALAALMEPLMGGVFRSGPTMARQSLSLYCLGDCFVGNLLYSNSHCVDFWHRQWGRPFAITGHHGAVGLGHDHLS
jgi:hypothetical protein